jgi:hypothetical protein
MVVPWEAPLYFKNLFSSILFMDEKYNSRKNLNPKHLGCKGILTTAFYFFI